MGYGYYVIDGKECGYFVDAVCEAPGCEAEIDRGVAYACGGEPGEFDDYCAGYFCHEHLVYTESDFGANSQRCRPCAELIEADEAMT
jgi:hypothetical protein